jgi:hypothetical protein
MPTPEKKKVPELRFGFRPSEKELPDRRSGAFRHKNTPAFIDILIKKIFETTVLGYCTI